MGDSLTWGISLDPSVMEDPHEPPRDRAADRAEHERLLTIPRAVLGEAVFAASWATGQAMKLKDAVAHALEG